MNTNSYENNNPDSTHHKEPFTTDTERVQWLFELVETVI